MFPVQGHPFSCKYLKQSRLLPLDAAAHALASQGHPFSCKYFKQSRCLFPAAPEHVISSQGHPFSCMYFKQSRLPTRAAAAQVFSLQGHPFSCKYLKQSRCPPLAATKHVLSSQGHPFSCKYLKQSRRPPKAAAAHTLVFQGHPFSCAYFKHSKCPRSAARRHVWSSLVSRDAYRVSMTSHSSARRSSAMSPFHAAFSLALSGRRTGCPWDHILVACLSRDHAYDCASIQKRAWIAHGICSRSKSPTFVHARVAHCRVLSRRVASRRVRVVERLRVRHHAVRSANISDSCATSDESQTVEAPLDVFTRAQAHHCLFKVVRRAREGSPPTWLRERERGHCRCRHSAT